MHWYVMHSKPNKEELLYEQLLIREIDAYFPRISVKPVNPRARKQKPYFPGYLFVRTDLEMLGSSTLKWMPGALGLVDFGNDPAVVPDELMNALRERVDLANDAYLQDETFRKGEPVKIESGPFAGYHAIFDTRLPGQERVRILLRLISDRQVGIELSSKQIKHLEQHHFW